MGSMIKLRRLTLGRIIVQILLLIWVVVTLYPIIWVAYSSLKTTGEILGTPFSLPTDPQFQNYVAAWNAFGKNATLGTFLINSIKVSVFSILMILALSIPAGYALARYQFRGKGLVFALIAMVIAVPAQGIMVPMFLQLNEVGLASNSHVGLAIAHTITNCAMPTLILSSFFRDIPVSVEEAALIDGCTELGKFFRIALPLCMPAVVTVLILTFVNVWNDLLFSLVFLTKSQYKTLTQGLAYFVNEGGVDYARTFAAVSISIIPIVIIFLFFQKSIISAMTAGAEKG